MDRNSNLLNRSKPFECEICHKSFGYRNQLKSHINMSHIVHDYSKPFECEICHKSFGNQNQFKRHISAVPDRIKPFECDICHTPFAEKSKLKHHMNTLHERIKRFECDICHNLFGFYNTLKIHQSPRSWRCSTSSMSSSNVRGVKTRSVPASSTTRSQLRIHMHINVTRRGQATATGIWNAPRPAHTTYRTEGGWELFGLSRWFRLSFK
uniref:C2H2-type domain-containing protein n=1 Tax=Trichogramma kaykai TaxID=54128 RepID=A0ABD2W1V3_9HYME